jgi:ABC-type branched-subunit amino acid transport system substrate-binding protein
MKRYRLLAALTLLLLLVLSAGCAKQPLIAEKSVEVPKTKTVKKTLPAPDVKPPEVKPAAIEPPVSSPPVIEKLPVAVDRNAVGCIFPLTGRFAGEGNKALDAVLLSADVSNNRFASPWKIIAADSGETPEAMKKAIAYLADEAKVMAIIAVSGSAEATVAAIEAQSRQVPIILIASKEGVTDAGEYVFQHFLTPAQQVEALTKYARAAMNIAIFSVLYPDDDYGEEMLRLFRQEVQKRGGKVAKAVLYDKTQTDFAKQIKDLKETKTRAGS